jgi:hypothetical protein
MARTFSFLRAALTEGRRIAGLHAGPLIAFIIGMRARVLLPILVVATAGACTQSLTANMSGTGGFTAGTGATGGTGPGTGGTRTGGTRPGVGGYAGNSATASCDTLTAEYQSALTAAQGCQVGAPGQCQTLVGWSLSGCSCPTYVTNSSVLVTVQSAWQAAGCASTARAPCMLECPAALNTACVATDGGSAGICSYASGTGGNSGTGATGGAGGSSCDTLAAEYAAVLIDASSCTAGATGQCAKAVPAALSPCGACTDYVNDDSVLSVLQKMWEDGGCDGAVMFCPPASPCLTAVGAGCLPSDAGGSVCSTVRRANVPGL